MKLMPAPRITGSVSVPGDKSISHRVLLLGAIAQGSTRIKNLSTGLDVQSTTNALKMMGVDISHKNNETLIKGAGKFSLKTPTDPIDCGNSGTTLRLLMGLLSGQNFSTTLTGDSSLQKRPMQRVSQPLSKMGAEIILTKNNFAPLTVLGRELSGAHHELQIPSAQIKSALMFAALYAKGQTSISGKIQSRDHTENLFPYFGIKIDRTEKTIVIDGKEAPHGADLDIPGDPSSAAFLAAAACLVKNSELEIRNISLNPTRIRFFEVLKRMGANIEFHVVHENPEVVGDLKIKTSELRATEILMEEIPFLIDELPLLAVVASQASGHTQVRGAQELRFKESDRLETLAENLRAMGVQINIYSDGFSITGPQTLHGTKINPHQDHRIAMSFSVAALIAQGTTEILNGIETVEISYPRFYETLELLLRK